MSRRALDVNWPAIQALYMQGIANAEIAAKVGVKLNTLESRIKRHRWNDQRRDVAVMAAKPATQQALAEVQSVSTKLREWFQNDATKLLAHIDSIPLVGMEWFELEKRQGIIKTTYNMISEMFDWNGETAKTPIQSQLLARLLDEVEGLREKRIEATVTIAPTLPEGEGSEPIEQPGETDNTPLPTQPIESVGEAEPNSI